MSDRQMVLFVIQWIFWLSGVLVLSYKPTLSIILSIASIVVGILYLLDMITK